MIYYLCFLLGMSLLTFILYLADKKRSEKKLYRISEKCLLLLSVCGGAIGGYLAMVIFRHKTQHWYFNVVNIVSIIIQIVIGVLIFVYL